MNLTPSQSSALEKLRGTGNVFLTGAAGTGKSFVIKQYMIEDDHNIAMLATTGMAAIILNGRTFHAFFCLWDVTSPTPERMAQSAMKNPRTRQRVLNADTIIIDEVSMLDEKTMMAGEMVARHCRNNDSPWGGLRVIAVGDFCQLPPVETKRKKGEPVNWIFDTDIWKKSEFEKAELVEIMRTGDTAFMDILNKVRRGVVDNGVRDFLVNHTVTEEQAEHIEGTRIFGRRVEVDSYNAKRMALLDAPEEVFTSGIQTTMMFDEAKSSSIKNKLLDNIPADRVLTLKEGALVMIRKNNLNDGYANGSLGHYVKQVGGALEIELLTGDIVYIERMIYEQKDGEGAVQMRAMQFPLSLAYASTIHKVQGATLDVVVADLGRLWDSGQAYVAMSRTKTAEGFKVLNWSAKSVIIDERIKKFYNF